ncbi:biotin-dependent carboxyltransferase family protein [Bacillus sp. 3255]|uniref:5-oxoprolinase subunit C family protein n=1 Tax=Bacillus sp. 3255 TaxID=2817904 RepID=UPI002864505D|nr:biotin-dependent carboxyltransferase family protein [Bacillus sp. 3255]MDR6878475.1 antagonist of KipI [Bacillus sp. 3255]
MGFRVVKPGLLSTLQDEGRFGYRKYGVIASGPMDYFAHRTANLLAGNRADAAVLEMTLNGPVLSAQADMLLALCGAGMEADVDGRPVSSWQPFHMEKGETLHVRYAVQGCRAYLAVHGGFVANKALGSTSTYLRAALGGYAGRALRAGDELSIGEARQYPMKRPLSGYVSTHIRPPYDAAPVVSVVAGKEAGRFTEQAKAALYANSFTVTPQSDRMGYRLEGEALSLDNGCPSEMISEAVTPGTIQVPPGGNPILLMADCQTTGGYPRIAQVITAHLPLVAQVKPGAALRFREVSLREAQEQLLLQAMDLRLLEAGLKAWAKNGRHTI